MDIYNYEVVDVYGNILKGSIDAEHQGQASQKLKDRGYMIIQLEKKKLPDYPHYFLKAKK